MLLFTLLLLSAIPNTDIITDFVDKIEINNVCNQNVPGVLFKQVIFYNFDEKSGTHQIIDWRMMQEGMKPYYDVSQNHWKLSWHDIVKGGCRRAVYAKSLSITYTLEDSESIQRKEIPEHLRKGLSSPLNNSKLMCQRIFERSVIVFTSPEPEFMEEMP